MIKNTLCLAGLFGVLAGPLAAQDLPGDPVAGKELAVQWCGECHDVIPDDCHHFESAPSFEAIAQTPAYTELALRAFLQTPHDRMPDIILDGAQTDDIIAYILSLRE